MTSTTSTDRVRRHRQRRQDRVVVVPATVTPAILGLLIGRGFLRGADAADRNRVRAALDRMLEADALARRAG